MKRVHPQSSPLQAAFLASLLLHLVILGWKAFKALPPSHPPHPSSLVYLSPSLPDEVVHTEDSNTPTPKEQDKRQLLSDKTQHVAHETVAKNRGVFKPKPLASSMAPQGSSVSPLHDTRPGENAPSNRSSKKLTWRDLGISRARPFEEAASSDFVPRAEKGEVTLFNTLKYKYASFYQRVEDLLEEVWKPLVEALSARLLDDPHFGQEGDLITTLWIWLDARGHILHLACVRSSGVGSLDDAAKAAFWKVTPLPQVPHGLYGKDGLARLNWDFILHVDSPGLL